MLERNGRLVQPLIRLWWLKGRDGLNDRQNLCRQTGQKSVESLLSNLRKGYQPAMYVPGGRYRIKLPVALGT